MYTLNNLRVLKSILLCQWSSKYQTIVETRKELAEFLGKKGGENNSFELNASLTLKPSQLVA